VVVEVGVPVFGGYLIPVDGHDPAFGELMGTNVPSMREPLMLKYQLIALMEPLEQSSAGVKPPDPVFRAAIRVERLNVWVVDGVIPAFARNWYVGSVWNKFTVVVKKDTASAPVGLPAGRHCLSSVL